MLDQAEIATDVMFQNRPQLLAIWPDLVGHAALNMSSEDVLGFSGRRLHPFPPRPGGDRHEGAVHEDGASDIAWAGSWVKVYDQASVAGGDAINNPREFRIQRRVTNDGAGASGTAGHGYRATPSGAGGTEHVQSGVRWCAQCGGLCSELGGAAWLAATRGWPRRR